MHIKSDDVELNQIVPVSKGTTSSSNGSMSFRPSVLMDKNLAMKHRMESKTGTNLTDIRFKEFDNDIRPNKIAENLNNILSSSKYHMLSATAVLIALFLTDLTRAVFSKDIDYTVEVIMVIVFFLLSLDLIAQSITYPKYPFSFFFWLDFIGTLTLLADMDLALGLVGYSYSDLTVARGGRAGRAARSAGSLRISRVVMWARVARLMKIARLFSFLKHENANKVARQEKKLLRRITKPDHPNVMSTMDLDSVDNQSDSHESSSSSSSASSMASGEWRDQQFRRGHSSKIGGIVADSITRNVVFGVLLTIGLTPIFSSSSEESYSAMFLAVDWLDYSPNNEYVADYANILISDYPNIVYLDVNGTSFRDDSNTMSELRDTEMMMVHGEHYTEIVLDVSATTRFGHVMNIGFTFVIVILFAALAFLITGSINKLVVHPIEKMTLIIQEFTKKVCVLGGDMKDQEKIVANLLETQVIEAAVGTLSKIFDAIIMPSSPSEKSKSKKKNEIVSANDDCFTNALPKNEGVTYIKTRDSVISINIQEKKRVFVSEEEIRNTMRKLEKSGDIHCFCVSSDTFPELTNVASTMQHPIASEYFRSYCYEHMAGESYSFVRAISDYYEVLQKEFDKIYTQYIEVGARNQIPIESTKRKKLKALYDANKFSVNSFDEFRMETIQSLDSQIFCSFQKSKWVSAYVLSIEELREKFETLKLRQYDDHKIELSEMTAIKEAL